MQRTAKSWLTSKEACELLGCSQVHFYRLMRKHRGSVKVERLHAQMKLYWKNDIAAIAKTMRKTK